MRKMKFLTTTTGGTPPVTYEKDKVYWLHEGSAMFHREAGAAVEAEPGAVASNDQPLPRRSNATVRVKRAGGDLRNVEVMGVRANAEPLSIRAAEKLQADLIAGRMPLPQAAMGLVSSADIAAAQPMAPADRQDPLVVTPTAPTGTETMELDKATDQMPPIPPDATVVVRTEAPLAPDGGTSETETQPREDVARKPDGEGAALTLTLKHIGRGKFNVIDADGEKVNAEPLTRDEGEALIAARTAGPA